MYSKIRLCLVITVVLLISFVFYTRLDAKLTLDNLKTPSGLKLKRGQASWYSEKSPGINRHTANNEVFDDGEMTCAIWGVPFNQLIKVTNLDNGKSIVVRVNDRGPHYRYFQHGRIVDLTKAAFENLASLHKGLINVEIEFLSATN